MAIYWYRLIQQWPTFAIFNMNSSAPHSDSHSERNLPSADGVRHAKVGELIDDGCPDVTLGNLPVKRTGEESIPNCLSRYIMFSAMLRRRWPDSSFHPALTNTKAIEIFDYDLHRSQLQRPCCRIRGMEKPGMVVCFWQQRFSETFLKVLLGNRCV